MQSIYSLRFQEKLTPIFSYIGRFEEKLHTLCGFIVLQADRCLFTILKVCLAILSNEFARNFRFPIESRVWNHWKYCRRRGGKSNHILFQIVGIEWSYRKLASVKSDNIEKVNKALLENRRIKSVVFSVPWHALNLIFCYKRNYARNCI